MQCDRKASEMVSNKNVLQFTLFIFPHMVLPVCPCLGGHGIPFTLQSALLSRPTIWPVFLHVSLPLWLHTYGMALMSKLSKIIIYVFVAAHRISRELKDFPHATGASSFQQI